MSSTYTVPIVYSTSFETQGLQKEVLSKAEVPSMTTLLKQRCLHWLGHVCPKDLLYGKLVSGKEPPRHPQLHFKDVFKWDLKATDINTNTW